MNYYENSHVHSLLKPLFRDPLFLRLQLVELKEAEQKSLKESERLEKEIADVQELKVRTLLSPFFTLVIHLLYITIVVGEINLLYNYFVVTEKTKYHDS